MLGCARVRVTGWFRYNFRIRVGGNFPWLQWSYNHKNGFSIFRKIQRKPPVPDSSFDKVVNFNKVFKLD